MSTIVDGRCDRCNELESACDCPATSIAVREIGRSPGHVRLAVFIGRTPGARGCAGELMLRIGEWAELQQQPRLRSGWLLLPIEVIDD